MNIGVQIDAETMERVEAMLAQVPKGAERAFSNAINRGLSKVKTGAFKEVKRVGILDDRFVLHFPVEY